MNTNNNCFDYNFINPNFYENLQNNNIEIEYFPDKNSEQDLKREREKNDFEDESPPLKIPKFSNEIESSSNLLLEPMEICQNSEKSKSFKIFPEKITPLETPTPKVDENILVHVLGDQFGEESIHVGSENIKILQFALDSLKSIRPKL